MGNVFSEDGADGTAEEHDGGEEHGDGGEEHGGGAENPRGGENVAPAEHTTDRLVDAAMEEMTASHEIQAPCIFQLDDPTATPLLLLCWTDMASATPRIARIRTLQPAHESELLSKYPDAAVPRTSDTSELGGTEVPFARTRVQDAIRRGGSVSRLGPLTSLHALALQAT